ncbi:MAG: hypothetical protein JWM96_674, partial [Alphaproteobacteria bacterium]|nr:hypothetical protein [Alphaproteobacteria bacterium]
MRNNFNFARVAQNFTHLLGYDWQESLDRGWYGIPAKDLDPKHQGILFECGQSFGYELKTGTSPSLGDTIIIDPKGKSGTGIYGSPASAAFIGAFGQVRAKHHTREAAAEALATNAWLQELYGAARMTKTAGPWSLGFGQSSFNSYKQSDSRGETVFMAYAAELVNKQAAKLGDGRIVEFSNRYTDTTQGQLKIRQPENPEILFGALHDTLADMAI